MKHIPKVKYSMKRYVGEGARLECEIKASNELLKQFYSIHPFISKDLLDIQSHYRHTIQTLHFNNSESLLYNIALNIFPLTKEDFGIYRAGVRLYQNSNEKVPSQSAHQLYDEIELCMCEFSVSQIDDYYIYTDVPVGGLLRFRELFLIAVSNSSNVRVEHIVNGVQLDLIPGITPKCCLNAIQSTTGNVLNMTLLKYSDYSSNTVDIFEIVATLCLCPSMFGIHRIRLVHDLYDPEEQKWITLEFMHPQITVVYPTLPALPWIHISGQDKNLIEISKNDKDFALFNGTLLQYVQSAKHTEFGLLNTLVDIIFNGAAILFVSAMYCPLYLVNVMIRIIVTNAIRKQRQQIHGCSNENPVSTIDTEKYMYAYDAFISYAEDDRQFVMETLQPILNQHRLRVFLGDDDLPPGPRLENSLTIIKQTKI
ncbi:hypothetical protein ACJMK2_000642, partial [Sinanodonta woodiana]